MTPDQETLYGLNMLALARKEGHRPKLPNMDVRRPPTPAQMRVLMTLDKRRTAQDVANLIGKTRHEASYILTALLRRELVVKHTKGLEQYQYSRREVTP